MTMLSNRVVKCALCGKESTHPYLASSSQLGCELDGRPTGMYRHTMECWAQICSNPKCGYASGNIAKESANARECVKSADYISHLKSPGMRETVRKFYLSALVALWAKNPSEAFEYFVYAAWACDDAGLAQDARAYRMLAVNLFSGEVNVTLVDLMRRAGSFNQAQTTIERVLASTELDDWGKKLLEFERKLIDAKDSGAHSTAELGPVSVPSAEDLGTIVQIPGKSDSKNFEVAESGLGGEFKALPDDLQEALESDPELPR